MSRRLVDEYAKAARRKARSRVEKAAIAEASRLSRHILESEEPVEVFYAFMTIDASRRHGSWEWDRKAGEKIERKKAKMSNVGGVPSKNLPSEVVTWKRLILKQLHRAFCTRSPMYRKEVAELRRNAKYLIGAIAGYVAGSVGVAEAVIAALVAALLRFIFKVGIQAFCEQQALIAQAIDA